MSAPGPQSSIEVEHEAEHARADLANTLEQLRDNLKPEHMAEEIVTNAKVGASNIAGGLFELARQNPLPAVLIGAGVALLLGLSTRSATKGLFAGGSSRTGAASRRLRSSVEAPSRRRSLAADDLARQAERGYSRVSQAAEELRRQAAAAPEPVTRAPDTRRAAKPTTAVPRQQAGSRISTLLQDQPLILGALGIAVGAAIGAALPFGETDDGGSGDNAEPLRHTVGDLAQVEDTELETAADFRQPAADKVNDFVYDLADRAKGAVDD